MKIVLFFILFFSNTFADQLKPESEGCPENAHCSKETGLLRKKWLETIQALSEKKISEAKANESISTTGFPINIWSKDLIESKNYPIIYWDSPCKQHKAPNQKILIGEIFTKNLSKDTREKFPEIIFSRVYFEEKDKVSKVFLPRGDAPLSIINNGYYFTKEDEGTYYGLMVYPDGKISLRKTAHIEKFPKEIECSKSLAEEFYRDAPSLNFYSGHFCKEIWNENLKKYSTILIGWSCN